MSTIEFYSSVVQNEGAVDRVVRSLIGWGLMGVAALDLANGATASWHGYAMIVAVYPILTAILGWDPFYHMMHTRSCSLEGTGNRCGSFPYEVTSLVGKNPPCSSELDCTLLEKHQGEKQQR